jgi:hypothetical protein
VRMRRNQPISRQDWERASARWCANRSVVHMRRTAQSEIIFVLPPRNLLESGAKRSHPEQCGWDTHWPPGYQSFALGLLNRIPRI